MKHPWVWVAVIVIGVASLFAASRLFAPEPIEQVVAPDGEEQPERPLPEEGDIPDSWQEIETSAYVIAAPESWTVTRPSDAENVELTLSSGINDDAYVDPDIVQINISAQEKDGRTLAEVAAGGWTEEDAAASVAFMQEHASPPYNEITHDDIVFEQTALVVNGRETIRTKFQCLKPCYIEGGAFTDVHYFIDADETVYVLKARTGVGEIADALMLSGEAVMQTFQLNQD
jgi:hypothetical protein